MSQWINRLTRTVVTNFVGRIQILKHLLSENRVDDSEIVNFESQTQPSELLSVLKQEKEDEELEQVREIEQVEEVPEQSNSSLINEINNRKIHKKLLSSYALLPLQRRSKLSLSNIQYFIGKSNESKLKRIIKYVAKLNNVKCPYDNCNFKLKSRSKLVGHLYLLHSKETFFCKICERKYSYKQNLVWHLRITSQCVKNYYSR